MTTYHQEPILLEPNRVQRFFRGGSFLDRWQGLPVKEDMFLSEDMCVNTSPYIGPDKPFDQGYSQTMIGGEPHRLASLIQSAPAEYLGQRYAERTHGQSGILCRIGDSLDRLVLQYHPTQAFAKKYFHHDFGKTEAWYIPKTRPGMDHCVYAGLRKGVTREAFELLFRQGDSEKLLACLHKLPLEQGDVILVPSGVPHAMGPGAIFVEFHEPCDYTLRLEKNFLGRAMAENELHYGLGTGVLMDGIDFSTYTYEEAVEMFVLKPVRKDQTDQAVLTELIGYGKNPSFALDQLVLHGTYSMPPLDHHYIAVGVAGELQMTAGGVTKTLRQGHAAFIPAGAARDIRFEGYQASVLLGYPFAIEASMGRDIR